MADNDNAAAANAGTQGQAANTDTAQTNNQQTTTQVSGNGQQAAGTTVLTGAEAGAAASGNEPGNKGEGNGKGTGKDGAQSAPETYAEFVMPENMPEGMQVDKHLIDSFAPLAKELNLNQEQAQKLVDLYSSRMLEQHKTLVDNHIAQVEQWQTQLPKDVEIGGTNGQQFQANAKIASQAFAKFGTPELGKLLEDTGLGNHPELVRFGLRIGKAISEDNMSGVNAGAGNGKGSPNKSVADRLYGN